MKRILVLCMAVQQQLYVDIHVGCESAPSLQQSCFTNLQASVRDKSCMWFCTDMMCCYK